MLNEKSGFHIVVMIHSFSGEGHLKGEGTLMDIVEHRGIN
jgi:hypothetical protein